MAKDLFFKADSVGADLPNTLRIYHTSVIEPDNFLHQLNKSQLATGHPVLGVDDSYFVFYIYEPTKMVSQVVYLPGPSVGSFTTGIVDTSIPAIWTGAPLNISGSGLFATSAVKFKNPNTLVETNVPTYTAPTNTSLSLTTPDLGTTKIPNVELKITTPADPSQNPTTTYTLLTYYSRFDLGDFNQYATAGSALTGASSLGTYYLSSPFGSTIKSVLDFGDYKYVYGDTLPGGNACDVSKVPPDGYYVKESQRPAPGAVYKDDFIFQIASGKVVSSSGGGSTQP